MVVKFNRLGDQALWELLAQRSITYCYLHLSSKKVDPSQSTSHHSPQRPDG